MGRMASTYRDSGDVQYLPKYENGCKIWFKTAYNQQADRQSQALYTQEGGQSCMTGRRVQVRLALEGVTGIVNVGNLFSGSRS